MIHGIQTARLESTITTLQTEIATRDRLLDDQAATIGKLEAKCVGLRSKIFDISVALDGNRSIYELRTIVDGGVQ